MKRLNAVIIRVLKELLRDKRTLALILFAPMLVLGLMNIVFDVSEDTPVKIGVNNTVPTKIVASFPTDSVKIKKYDNETSTNQLIKDNDLDAFVTLEDSTIHIRYKNEDPANTAKVKAIVTNVLTNSKIKELTIQLQKFVQVTHQQQNKSTNYSVKNSYMYGSANSTFFDRIFPILIGFFIFFFVFLISGVALLKERTSRTLERLLATPVKRSEIVLGYLVGYGILAILQTIFIVFFSIFILDVSIAGNILWVLATTILFSLVALSMGIFVSTFANTEFQMIQFIPIVVVPQIFFSGIISLDSMAPWVKNISYIFPLSYAGEALSNIMIKGDGFESIWLDLLILIVFISVFTLLNILGLKRYRKV